MTEAFPWLINFYELEVCKLLIQLKEHNMREIQNLAQVMRDTISDLKKQATDAASGFQTEVGHTKDNIAKVQSLTQELQDANKEVEQVLGQSGSNFTPTPTTTSTGVKDGRTPPPNVTLNPVAK